MTNIFKNLSEIIGVFSAFIIFFALKGIGISPFLAFPLCMLSGWGIAIFFKNNRRENISDFKYNRLLLNKKDFSVGQRNSL